MKNILTWLKAKLLLLSVAVVWVGSAFLYIQVPYTDFNFYLAYVYLITALIQFTGNAWLKRYGYSWWILTDQAVNVIHGGNPDVTVSSKVGFMAEKGSKTAAAMAYIIDLLFYIAIKQENHCAVSIERDEEHW